MSPITLQEVVLLIALGCGEQTRLVANSADCLNHAFLFGRFVLYHDHVTPAPIGLFLARC